MNLATGHLHNSLPVVIGSTLSCTGVMYTEVTISWKSNYAHLCPKATLAASIAVAALCGRGEPPVTPAANLSPSITPAAHCHRYQRHQWQITWEQYQTADTLKWTWRIKIIYMLTLQPKGVQTSKQLKLFWMKFFSSCHWCQRHRWCTLSCKYLLKALKGNGGNWVMKKNWSRKSRGTVPLINISFVRSNSIFTRSY